METAYAHIACCCDDSEASGLALAEARRLRSLDPGRLSLVHVVQWPLPHATARASRLPGFEQIVKAERAWLDDLGDAVPEAQPVLLKGEGAAEACRWAAEAGVDLLVVAPHRGPAGRTLLGSFAHYCIHHAPCEVLVVRPRVSSRAPSSR